MEKKTCFYETLFVISGNLSEEDAKATEAKFTDLIAANGTLIRVDEWGKRRLAYPINKVNEGYYVLASFESTPDFPLELDRLLGINDAIMRGMTVRLLPPRLLPKRPLPKKPPKQPPSKRGKN